MPIQYICIYVMYQHKFIIVKMAGVGRANHRHFPGVLNTLLTTDTAQIKTITIWVWSFVWLSKKTFSLIYLFIIYFYTIRNKNTQGWLNTKIHYFSLWTILKLNMRVLTKCNFGARNIFIIIGVRRVLIILFDVYRQDSCHKVLFDWTFTIYQKT